MASNSYLRFCTDFTKNFIDGLAETNLSKVVVGDAPAFEEATQCLPDVEYYQAVESIVPNIFHVPVKMVTVKDRNHGVFENDGRQRYMRRLSEAKRVRNLKPNAAEVKTATVQNNNPNVAVLHRPLVRTNQNERGDFKDIFFAKRMIDEVAERNRLKAEIWKPVLKNHLEDIPEVTYYEANFSRVEGPELCHAKVTEPLVIDNRKIVQMDLYKRRLADMYRVRNLESKLENIRKVHYPVAMRDDAVTVDDTDYRHRHIEAMAELNRRVAERNRVWNLQLEQAENANKEPGATVEEGQQEESHQFDSHNFASQEDAELYWNSLHGHSEAIDTNDPQYKFRIGENYNVDNDTAGDSDFHFEIQTLEDSGLFDTNNDQTVDNSRNVENTLEDSGVFGNIEEWPVDSSSNIGSPQQRRIFTQFLCEPLGGRPNAANRLTVIAANTEPEENREAGHDRVDDAQDALNTETEENGRDGENALNTEAQHDRVDVEPDKSKMKKRKLYTYAEDSDDGNVGTKRSRFQCNECGKKYTASGSFHRHYETEHREGGEPFCIQHNRSYMNKSRYNEHVKKMHGLPMYKCAKCGKTFRSRSSQHHHRKNCA